LVKGTVVKCGDTVGQADVAGVEAAQSDEIVAGRFDFTDMADLRWATMEKTFTRPAGAIRTALYGLHGRRLLGQNRFVLGAESSVRQPERDGATTVEVKSVVQPADSSDQPIQINYLVKHTAGGWKVYDVTVDYISITANYRKTSSLA